MPLLTSLRKLSRDDEAHFVELARHFFQRFFDNEFVATGSESRLTVISIVSLLAVPPFFYTMHLIAIYGYIGTNYPALYPVTCLVEQCRYVFFAMVVVGFIAVLEWDALLPDRKDYANLMPLPLKARTIFAAKLTALGLFAVLFILGANGIPALLYPFVEAVCKPGPRVTLLGFCRMTGAHGCAVFGGSIFVFLFFIAMRGLLTALLSYRWFRRVSLCVQIVSMMGLLLLFFSMPAISLLLPHWERTGSYKLYLIPPIWFLGLYQNLLGSRSPLFQSLAHLAIEALAIVIVISGLAYFLSYKRQT